MEVPHHKETKVFVAHLAAVDQGIRYPQVGAHCDPQGESGGPPLRRPAGHLLEMAPRQAPPPASTRLLWPPVAWAMWARQQSTETSEGLKGCGVDHRLFFSPPTSTRTCTPRYLQPPFVEPMCVSGHCAPRPRFSYGIVRGAYDMWMFRGSRAWSQWGVVHRFHVLLACRKFWFSNISGRRGRR
jgi:hypothetical protein